MNFCRSILNPLDLYWCYNAPSGIVYSSLTFNYNFLTAGAYNLGVNYACNRTDNGLILVEVDGVQSFGNILAPLTGGAPNFAVTAGSQSATISAGLHTIKLIVVVGSVEVDSFLLSLQPIAGTVPTPTPAPLPVPNGATAINAMSYVSGMGTPSLAATHFSQRTINMELTSADHS